MSLAAFGKLSDSIKDDPEKSRMYASIPGFLWPLPYNLLEGFADKSFLPTVSSIELSSRYRTLFPIIT
jgi:hypothetical protein